jgi:DNA topoisomerase VI, subunit A
MTTPSPVLFALARHYEKSHAGRTGRGTLDVSIELETLLREANCRSGDAREIAERQLRELDGKLLELEFAHKKDKSNIFKVRISPANEAEFFCHLGLCSPLENRRLLAEQFRGASANPLVSERWRSHWKKFCNDLANAAENVRSVEPFDRSATDSNAELLTLLPKLLAWEGESLVRFASCLLGHDSKKLELLAAREKHGEFEGKLRGKLGRILEKITEGKIRTLDDLGILANPRFALVHGPLRLLMNGTWLDLGILHGPCRISLQDIVRAEKIETEACRCLTVENETSFHELAKLQSGELLIQTSYPGAATVKLLRLLPSELEYWHFGDSDKAGFEILDNLREKSGCDFHPLHMRHGRIPFEQESLGKPELKVWPFYQDE